MQGLGTFALRHYSLVLFAATLVEQLGLPLPVAPLLLGAGALARTGESSAPLAVLLYLTASSLAHVSWFFAGRWRGSAVLQLLCRISIEPDSCVRRTENLFSRYGAKLLFGAPFIPGLGLVAPPLAGISGMPLQRFAPIDSAGSAFYAVVLVTAGYLFGPALAAALLVLQRVAGSVGAGLLLLLALYLVGKLIARYRLLRELRIARITPQELWQRLEAADASIFVIDLRHAVELEVDRRTLPGALRIALEELDVRHGEIPRDREIALYCS